MQGMLSQDDLSTHECPGAEDHQTSLHSIPAHSELHGATFDRHCVGNAQSSSLPESHQVLGMVPSTWGDPTGALHLLGISYNLAGFLSRNVVTTHKWSLWKSILNPAFIEVGLSP